MPAMVFFPKPAEPPDGEFSEPEGMSGLATPVADEFTGAVGDVAPAVFGAGAGGGAAAPLRSVGGAPPETGPFEGGNPKAPLPTPTIVALRLGAVPGRGAAPVTPGLLGAATGAAGGAAGVFPASPA